MSLKDSLKRLVAKPYENVAPGAAAQLVEDGAVLLDVREDYEWEAGHAPRARHIPLGQLRVRMHEVPEGRPVVTICRSGHRSAHAATMLADTGRATANVAGGMQAWVRAGLPITAKGGGPGRVA
jgi:rhodanese-related sulfurtransferase